MITAIGVDIVDVARVPAIVGPLRHKICFRILGKEETVLLRSRHDAAQFVAGRFAAKEALGQSVRQIP